MMHNLLEGYYWRSPYPDVLADWLVEPRRFIQVVSEPRQTGKTTLALQAAGLYAASHHYAMADDPYFQDAAWIEQQWNLGRERAWDDRGHGAVLLLDEIQKVSGWLETVKRLWFQSSLDR